jgi:hypothetical protein
MRDKSASVDDGEEPQCQSWKAWGVEFSCAFAVEV